MNAPNPYPDAQAVEQILNPATQQPYVDGDAYYYPGESVDDDYRHGDVDDCNGDDDDDDLLLSIYSFNFQLILSIYIY